MNPKNEIRRRIFTRRDLVSPEEAHAAARAVATRGLALARAHLPANATIAAYWPIRSEMPTRRLMEALVAEGFRTCLPVTRETRTPLVFRLWSVGDDLAKGVFGNAEPLAGAPEIAPAMLFMPLAAFDANGGRVGHGAGHYDTTLASLRSRGRVLAAGLAFDIQEIDAVPLEPHDQRLDFIVTETRTITVSGIA